MLSLALLPTLGRLGAGPPVNAATAMADGHGMPAHMPGMAVEMAGHAHVPAHDATRRAHPQRQAGEHEGHDGHDCSYCLLLSGLVGTAALHWVPPAALAIADTPTRAIASRVLDAPVPGLGAQAPPSFESG